MRDFGRFRLVSVRTRLFAAAGAATVLVAATPAVADFGCAATRGTVLERGADAVKTAPVEEGGAFDISAIPAPPVDDYKAYVEHMRKWRGDDPAMLAARWARYQSLVRNNDLRGQREKEAFLLTAREEFARTRDPERVYAHAFLAIGCGVTISGPHIVGRMTQELDIKPGDKVLEIGTGSGYQSAVLSYLTENVYTVEIIPPILEVTDRIYNQLSRENFPQLRNVRRKTADGYFGWEEHAPFDKIIVTAGIDHIPPPLLQQLAVGGTMIIPVGPPGSQALLKVTKEKSDTGRVRIARHDIYANDPSRAGGGRRTRVSFVPFTKYEEGGRITSRWGSRKE